MSVAVLWLVVTVFTAGRASKSRGHERQSPSWVGSAPKSPTSKGFPVVSVVSCEIPSTKSTLPLSSASARA